MSNNQLWLTLLFMGVITLSLRGSFIFLWRYLRPPDLLISALKYVPAAVLAALVLPAVLNAETLQASVISARFPAAIIAVIIAWWRKNVLITITAGMLSLWALKFLGL